MIQYTTKNTLDGILSPAYFGYMTRLMEIRGNLPENYMDDFPQYAAPRNIEKYSPKKGAAVDLAGYFTVPTYENPIFERTIFCQTYKNMCSPDPKNMQMGLATIFRNMQKGGRCYIKWEFCDELYDYIVLLSAAFGTVEISAEWIHCRDFHLAPAAVDKIMAYFRYALDCPGTIYPFKKIADKKKLDAIFKKLFN
jgi:hypothetical protein